MSFREERRLLADHQRPVALTGASYCPTNSQPELASYTYVENWISEERRLLADFHSDYQPAQIGLSRLREKIRSQSRRIYLRLEKGMLEKDMIK